MSVLSEIQLRPWEISSSSFAEPLTTSQAVRQLRGRAAEGWRGGFSSCSSPEPSGASCFNHRRKVILRSISQGFWEK